MQDQPQKWADKRAELRFDQHREARGKDFQEAAHVLRGKAPPVRPMANSMEIMTQPVCLIETDPDGSLHIVDDSLKILQQIEQPVVVISVVGLYRTGKSYLMNKLAGKHKGFALGNTVESKTKGIWMWCVPHPTKPDHTLVLLDTEGLGDVEKGDEKHDTWIFCLAVLLSSTLVYNSMGTIDNSALEKLHYVTELTEYIKVKSSPGEDLSTQFMRVFPSFIWAVRDFSLDLEINGKSITADQYLDNALKLKKGNSPRIQKHNQPRECLQNFFCARKCFVFIRPTNEQKMKKMEDLEDEELEPNFVDQATDFCNYIFSNAKTKTMNGNLKLTGKLLGILADMYVKAIESGQVPCLDNAVVELAQIQNSRAMTEALEHYQREMSQRVSYPTETLKELSEVHSAAEKEAVRIFIDNSFKDEDQKKQLELMEKLYIMYSQMCEKNVEESLHACRNIIKRVFAPVEKKLRDGYYLRSCGHTEYSINLKVLSSQYRSEGGRGIKSEDVLADYLEGKEVIGKTILAADKSFSATERISQLQSEKNKVQEQKLKAVEEQNRILHQELEDQKRTFDENMKQLEKKLKADAQREMEELDRVLNAKMKFKMNLMEQGFKTKAEVLESEIKALQEKKEDWFPKLKMTIKGFGQTAGLVIPGARVVADAACGIIGLVAGLKQKKLKM